MGKLMSIDPDFNRAAHLAEKILEFLKGEKCSTAATAIGMAASDVLAETELQDKGVTERFIHNLRMTVSESLPETNS